MNSAATDDSPATATQISGHEMVFEDSPLVVRDNADDDAQATEEDDPFLEEDLDALSSYQSIVIQFSPLSDLNALSVTLRQPTSLVCSVADQLVSLGFARCVSPLAFHTLIAMRLPSPVSQLKSQSRKFQQRFAASLPSLYHMLQFFAEPCMIGEAAATHIANGSHRELHETVELFFDAVWWLMQHLLVVPQVLTLVLVPSQLRIQAADGAFMRDDDDSVASRTTLSYANRSEASVSDDEDDGLGRTSRRVGSFSQSGKVESEDNRDEVAEMLSLVVEKLEKRVCSGKTLRELVQMRVLTSQEANIIVEQRDSLLENGLMYSLQDEYEVPG
jgi:hypothetical protein